MARLIIKRERATGPFPLKDFPPGLELQRDSVMPDDGRPKVTRDEHQYWRSDDRLAYGAHLPFPEEDLPLLMGEAEHNAKMRGEPWPKRGRK
ncbi:MAG: hypothetical protein JWO62_2633 [Acidimicrobiaceae bacterium]|nr:hypothetical protein [Acidimicrobiaceae bacterium]